MEVKTAKVTVARAKASPRAVARAKKKAKEDVVVRPRRMKRTRRSLRGNTNVMARVTKGDPSSGQQNTGPTTCSQAQAQAQQEQGAKRSNKDGDEFGPRKRTRLMRIVRKLRKKGFDITLLADLSQGHSQGCFGYVSV